MKQQSEDAIKTLASAVMNDAIVSASEYISVPGNTVEAYVDGLLVNYVDTNGMSEDDISLLKKFLIEFSQKEIEDSKSAL